MGYVSCVMSGTATAMTGPDWNRLYEIAAAQEGHFTTVQAAEAGYYPQLLVKYLRNGRVARIRRGVYRLIHFPAGEHEDLVVTALAQHDLSDVMPARVHVTLPDRWRKRRLRVPTGVVLHFANVAKADRAWVGSIPVTAPTRTLRDCAAGGVSPETMRKAFRDATSRGLVGRSEVAALRRVAPGVA
jgi:predicted transcriptional regulator of viral defense system